MRVQLFSDIAVVAHARSRGQLPTIAIVHSTHSPDAIICLTNGQMR